ncbi:MAG: cupin domain-containing protein [Candidatus Aminicenantes bacterium]|nr:cupin domain-containing protein [Candidatus Aminicenantes bacterium]
MTIQNEFKEKSQSLKNAVEYSQGSVVSKTIIDKKSGTVTLFAFDKEQNLSEHTTPYDALVLVIDGEGEIIIDQKTHRVDTGSMILMPAHKPHAVNASSKFKMLLIMIKD